MGYREIPLLWGFWKNCKKSTFSKVASDCVDGKGLPLKAHFDLFYNSLAGEEKKTTCLFIPLLSFHQNWWFFINCLYASVWSGDRFPVKSFCTHAVDEYLKHTSQDSSLCFPCHTFPAWPVNSLLRGHSVYQCCNHFAWSIHSFFLHEGF